MSKYNNRLVAWLHGMFAYVEECDMKKQEEWDLMQEPAYTRAPRQRQLIWRKRKREGEKSITFVAKPTFLYEWLQTIALHDMAT